MTTAEITDVRQRAERELEESRKLIEQHEARREEHERAAEDARASLQRLRLALARLSARSQFPIGDPRRFFG